VDWVRGFYEKQGRWADVYCGDVEPRHRERAELVRKFTPRESGRVLELGCGGGQTAAAIADLGYDVTAIDLVPDAVEHAQRLADSKPDRLLHVQQADFYDVAFDDPFDAICYFDGFGIGSDTDQQRLLGRIESWLNHDGRALIEVYAPDYWRQVAGRTMTWDDVGRRYGFDQEGSRMLDTWWRTDAPSETITQSLRCYTRDEFEAMAHVVGLGLKKIVPGGAVDYECGVYRERVPLDEAMQYIAVLGHYARDQSRNAARRRR